jgi:hypothetical protein
LLHKAPHINIFSRINYTLQNSFCQEGTAHISRSVPTVYLLFAFEWHCSLKAHPPHPQEQEDLPFFLFTISLTTIATNIAPTIAAIIIVGHIKAPPFESFGIYFIFVAFLFLLTSIYKRNTATTAANTVPIISPFPMNHAPN